MYKGFWLLHSVYEWMKKREREINLVTLNICNTQSFVSKLGILKDESSKRELANKNSNLPTLA